MAERVDLPRNARDVLRPELLRDELVSLRHLVDDRVVSAAVTLANSTSPYVHLSRLLCREKKQTEYELRRGLVVHHPTARYELELPVGQ